jgi:hypothetical protein
MTPNNPAPSSFIDAIRGPILLIALGILMAMDQVGQLGIDRSWPVLLILFGVLKMGAYLGAGDRR